MRLKTGMYVVNNKKSEKCDVSTVSYNEDKSYTYDEAIDMTGHGAYSIGLLLVSALSIFGCVLDMFAQASIFSAAACDLQLTSWQETILASIPFIGAIIMAYPWGYISDIKGRRASMLASMWLSFVSSCLAAFSTHWIMFAILKLISVGCSSCSFTIAFTIVGECCSSKVKAVYFFLLTSIIHLAFPFQMGLYHYTLTLDFSIDLGVIKFIPWRLLDLALALPMGISAFFLHFHYESPKFLLNAGLESEAIDILGQIWRRNGKIGNYPVKKLYLNEEGNSKPSAGYFMQSVWNQTKPLFKAPLLIRTLQLYFLGFALYGSCGGLYSWSVYLANAFISGTLSEHNRTDEGLCNMITQYSRVSKEVDLSVSCLHKSDIIVVYASLVQGCSLSILNIIISTAATRRKLIMIIIFTIAGLAAFGCAFLTNNVASLVSYFAIFLVIVGAGIILSYFVDLYPTSYRGMVSCLSMVVCRIGNLVAVNFIGGRVMDHCNSTFYLISALLFSGAIVACFLPPDKPKDKS